jgi:hypothetical protein
LEKKRTIESSTENMRMGEARLANDTRRGRGGTTLVAAGVVVTLSSSWIAAAAVAGSGAGICGSEEQL